MRVPESVKSWLKKATTSSGSNEKEAVVSTKVNHKWVIGCPFNSTENFGYFFGI